MSRIPDPLRPGEEKEFVPLAGGMVLDLRLRVGLSLPAESGPGKGVFAEQRTFPDLGEAVAEVDPATGQPYPAFALLGEPGAGKSTLLRKLARDAVRRRLAAPAAPLPLFVSLSDHKSGSPLAFLREHYRRAVGYDGLESALEAGRVWLFADGLNEMDHRGYYQRVAQWREFARRHLRPGGNRALVACREADYGEGLALPRLLIHAMDEQRIREFLGKRNPARADALWDELERDRREGRGDLYPLATVPFWLVMIADLARLPGGLPRNRAALAEQFVARWLDYEADRPGGTPLDSTGRAAFADSLTRLAWRGLARSQNYAFRKGAALRLLTAPPGLGAPDWLTLACSCSLLAAAGNTVRFQHQLLQEYFAARELARRFSRRPWARRLLPRLWRVPWRRWRFVRSRWDPLPEPPRTGWEEATVLATGLPDLLGPETAERLTLAVLPHNAPLAARCALEAGVEMAEPAQRAVSARLLVQLHNPRLRLPARLAAGRALGKLGDPRILAGKGAFRREDGKAVTFIEPAWVDVPAGSFRMGSDRADRLASADERPVHTVALTRAYRIGRFPVTVAEYRCFVEAGGYADHGWWQAEAARRWLRGELKFEESYQAFLLRELKQQAEQVLPELDRLVRAGRLSPMQAQALRATAEMSEESARARWRELEAEKRDSAGRARAPWLWGDPRYTNPSQPVVGV
ncbi:MAG: SUMF1/EgtB/PvdO family nonheme iron enzyme, partial [Chloroflexi bacterium]|nr:SUMF1/EgtB/PvdO family nonheme iron enzyme [Chloroflexota bacterium]